MCTSSSCCLLHSCFSVRCRLAAICGDRRLRVCHCYATERGWILRNGEALRPPEVAQGSHHPLLCSNLDWHPPHRVKRNKTGLLPDPGRIIFGSLHSGLCRTYLFLQVPSYPSYTYEWNETLQDTLPVTSLPTCPLPPDAAALLHFKANMSNGELVLASWDPDTPVCSWGNVTCDEGGQVTGM